VSIAATGQWYASATFWAGAGVIVAVVFGLGNLFNQYAVAPRRKLTFGMPVDAPLVSGSDRMGPGLEVRYTGKPLTDPRILEIHLASRGSRDIPSDVFDQGRPLVLDVGIPIVTVLQSTSVPASAPVPDIETEGQTLKVGPGLIQKGQALTFTVLADGPSAQLTCQSYLINVKIREQRRDQLIQLSIRRITGWAIVIFLIWYLLTDPVGAAQALTDIGNAIVVYISTPVYVGLTVLVGIAILVFRSVNWGRISRR
jgi:hypothetical protein